MPKTLNEALAELDARITVTRGAPASDAWIADAQKTAKTTFCPTYIAFLREHGALRFQADLASWYGDFALVGHAPDDPELSLEAARTWLEDVAEEWHHEPPVCAPVLVPGGGGSDAGVTVDGGIAWFHRYAVYAEHTTFESLALRWIATAAEKLGVRDQKASLREDLLGACAALVPASLHPTREGGRLSLTRPADGVAVELRLGDGRELGDRGEPGLFVSWFEEGERPLAQLNEYNLQSAFVRAAHVPGRVRYRGLLPARELAPAQLLAALAHDAGLELGVAAPASPILAELVPLMAEPPSVPPARYPKRWRPEDIRREGDELRFCVAAPRESHARFGPLGPPDVWARVNAHGLVEVGYRAQIGVEPLDALTSLNDVNRHTLSEGNLDLEPCVKATLEGSVATLRIVTTAAALPSEAFLAQLRALGHAISDQTCLAQPDPMDALCPQLEREFRLPLGVAGRALWENILNRRLPLLRDCFDRRSSGPTRLASPWGEVACFARTSGPGSSVGTHLDSRSVTLAIGVEHGATFDECPVIGIGDTVFAGDPNTDVEAQLLAPDLRSFLTVLVLGTTGYGFDGDDALVWRDYRSEDLWFTTDRTQELREKLGIEATRDIEALQSAAERKVAGPRTGRVRNGG